LRFGQLLKKGKKKKEKTGKGPTVLFLRADPDSTETCAPILIFFATCPDPWHRTGTHPLRLSLPAGLPS
jgi:hypothetical protein